MAKFISQLKSDIRACRCKSFSLKEESGLMGGGWAPAPLDPPLLKPSFYKAAKSKIKVNSLKINGSLATRTFQAS